MKEIPLLTTDDIEVKVKQVTKGGALALLYKTARTDRRILSEVFGPLNWTSDFKVVKDNLYCGIGVREKEGDPFIWRWDCGIESGQDDGSEKKAEASDAFKRAGFAVGIGEELYTSPVIWLDVLTEPGPNNKYVLKNRYAKFFVTRIEYNKESRRIIGLDIENEEGTNVFSWDLDPNSALGKKLNKVTGINTDTPPQTEEVQKPKKSRSKKAETVVDSKQIADKVDTVAVNPETGVVLEIKETTNTVEDKKSLQQLQLAIGSKVKAILKEKNNMDQYKAVVKEVTGTDKFMVNAATKADYDTVLAIYNKFVVGQ